jgi:hypothetical protein
MEIRDVIALPEGPRRTAAIVAWIQSLFADDEQAPVLVGGAAVEIFTGGAYTTGDLDFVGHLPRDVESSLQASGFRKAGRHWINDEAEIFLEFPGSALDPDERSVRRRAFGFDVILISIEDLLVDRLGSWAYWKSGVDGANAFALYRACREDIDHDRLRRRADDAGFGHALEALRAFDANWPNSEPDPTSLEKWANKGPDANTS